MEFLTIGQCGGEGGNPWSFVENNGGIIGMKIIHGDTIDSITFKCGDEYGILQHSKMVVGSGGSKTNEVHIYCYYSVTLIMHFCETRN